MGVSQPLLLEKHAQNTGDNAQLSARLLIENGYHTKTIHIVTKPYMERRAIRTFEKQWPDCAAQFSVSSLGGSFDSYICDSQTHETVVHIMV